MGDDEMLDLEVDCASEDDAMSIRRGMSCPESPDKAAGTAVTGDAADPESLLDPEPRIKNTFVDIPAIPWAPLRRRAASDPLAHGTQQVSALEASHGTQVPLGGTLVGSGDATVHADGMQALAADERGAPLLLPLPEELPRPPEDGVAPAFIGLRGLFNGNRILAGITTAAGLSSWGALAAAGCNCQGVCIFPAALGTSAPERSTWSRKKKGKKKAGAEKAVAAATAPQLAAAEQAPTLALPEAVLKDPALVKLQEAVLKDPALMKLPEAVLMKTSLAPRSFEAGDVEKIVELVNSGYALWDLEDAGFARDALDRAAELWLERHAR